MEVWELKLYFYPSIGGLKKKQSKKQGYSLRFDYDVATRHATIRGIESADILVAAVAFVFPTLSVLFRRCTEAFLDGINKMRPSALFFP